MSRAQDARDVPALLAALTASDPGRPRLTWYGDGERVELSARVLANWVVKTANLLGDDLDAGNGTTVRLDLPPHWRTVVWWLAVGAAGAGVVAAGEPADVVVGTAPPAHVVVALPALARAAGPLPPGALDYNAAVGGQPDELSTADEPTPLPVAAGPAAPGVRLLVTADRFDVPRVLLPAWLADGSVLLVGPGVDAAPLVAQERVTADTHDVL